jgi:hypothetical protein
MDGGRSTCRLDDFGIGGTAPGYMADAGNRTFASGKQDRRPRPGVP